MSVSEGDKCVVILESKQRHTKMSLTDTLDIYSVFLASTSELSQHLVLFR